MSKSLVGFLFFSVKEFIESFLVIVGRVNVMPMQVLTYWGFGNVPSSLQDVQTQ